MQVAHYAKCSFVRHADITNFSRALVLCQCVQRIQQRNRRRRIRPAITEFAEAVGWALLPVHLIEIEVISLQTLEAVMQRFADILPIQRLIRADALVIIARRSAHFGGDN